MVDSPVGQETLGVRRRCGCRPPTLPPGRRGRAGWGQQRARRVMSPGSLTDSNWSCPKNPGRQSPRFPGHGKDSDRLRADITFTEPERVVGKVPNGVVILPDRASASKKSASPRNSATQDVAGFR